jgi:hypothetical protein
MHTMELFETPVDRLVRWNGVPYSKHARLSLRSVGPPGQSPLRIQGWTHIHPHV